MPRLVTFNTWKCDGDYHARLPLMIEGLARLDADVIALQECFRAPEIDADTARNVAAALDMELAHTPARRESRVVDGAEVSSSSGLAVLSRTPIERVEVIRLPEDPRDGERIAQFVWTTLGTLPMLVVNLHLCYLPDAGELRRRQLEAVLAERGRLAPRIPAALLGDFNAAATDPELGPLRALASIQWGTSDLAALPPTNGGVHHAPRAVDHMVLLPAVGDADPGRGALTLRRRAPALTEPDAHGVRPSDHAAVVADLEVSPTSRVPGS